MSNDGFIPDDTELDDGFVVDEVATGNPPTSGAHTRNNLHVGLTAASKAMELAPWNKVASIFPKSAEYGAGKLGEMGVNPKVAATAMLPVAMAPDLLGTVSSPETAASKVSLAAPSKVIGKVADYADDVATNAARRSLGFTKRFLNKPGNLNKANEASRAMLDEGVIQNPILHPFSSGTESMLGRTEKLMDTAGQKMGMTRQMLDTNGIPGPHAKESADIILNGLNPRFKDEVRVGEEIVEDIMALGKERLSYEDAFTVLKKLDEKAKYSPMGGPTDQLKANMYRKAYGMFRKELDQAVERGAVMMGDLKGDMSGNYGNAKKLFGKASNAKKALTNKLSSEAGNNRIGLREAIVVGGELASGNPVGAVAAAGAMEGAKRFGNAGLANTANAAAKVLRKVPTSLTLNNPLSRPGMIPEAGKAVESMMAPVSEAVAAGMVLTSDKAKEYLRQAKGDKELARKMAREDGYSF